MDILCKGGRIDGNCSPAAANTEGAARGEAGAAAGGGEAGKAKNASEHSHLVQCGPLFPGRGGGWVGSAFYRYTEPRKRAGAQVWEKQVHSPRVKPRPQKECASPHPPPFPFLALIQCKL